MNYPAGYGLIGAALRASIVAMFSALALLAGHAGAQGVTADAIVIGQSASLSGPSAELGREMKAGADAYFNAINESGGVLGRKIKLISIDDAGVPDRAKANTLKLLNEDNVFALFGYTGTHTINPILPLVEKNKVPFFAPASGDVATREPLSRYIYNIRASYLEETEKIVEQLIRRGLTKIALFYQNDAYGRAGLAGLERALRERKSNIVIFGSADRNSVNVASSAQTIAKSGAQAVLISAGANTASAFIKEMKKLGSNAQFCLLSSVGAMTVAAQLGEDGRGVEVSQVVPLPFSDSEPLGREYLKRIGGTTKASFASFEGYIAANVFVEGLKKAGKVPTRESFLSALDRLGTVDLRGYRVKFSADNHNGSSLVELTVLGAGGNYKR
ncbi:MAG: ABC transporter substrate-binding protein [Burkholderiales bacterium]|nr:ABC transporter substrate-binding protein [Burkholderiales bacterium]